MSDRNARRKILLLKGTLYRLEIMHARHALQNAAGRNMLASMVPELLKSAISNNRAALLTTVLTLLLGRGRWRRYVRRALLAAGGMAAAWSMFRRRKDGAVDEVTTAE